MIENKLLAIRQLYNTEIAIVMYKYKKNFLPDALQNLFQIKTSQIKTRSNSQIVSSSFKTTISQQSIKYVGPKVWNALPIEIKNSNSLALFKNN